MVIDFFRRLYWRFNTVMTGNIRSNSGYVGNMREPGVLGRFLRRLWWVIPIIAGIIVFAYLASAGRLPSLEISGQARIVPAPSNIFTRIDECRVSDGTGRRYVAEDCLTFVEAAAGTVQTYPVQSVIAFVLWAAIWYGVGRAHQRAINRR